jgi:uncharacterized membrane protein
MRTFVLVLHILGAIVALGFSLTYGLWTARGELAGRTERSFALRTISWVDQRFTTPAYIAQVVTGLLLVALIDWSLLSESWLAISIGLYVAVTVLAITMFAPAHRRQSLLADRIAAGEAVDDAEYRAAAGTAQRWGAVVTVLTVLIVVLMITKPTWW